MKIRIKIHPNSFQEKVSKINDNELEVWINERPFEGNANIALIKILKKYLGKEVRITSGLTSRKKVVEVLN